MLVNGCCRPTIPSSGCAAICARGRTNGIAIEHLTRIIASSDATLRQKLRACALLLSYRSDNDTNAFARAFLEKAVSDPDTPIDYKLEGLEQLRKAMGDPQLKPSVVKLTPPSVPRDPEAERREREIMHAKRRKHLEEQSIKDAEMLRQDLERASLRLVSSRS
jgi:hypothetical protein